MDEYEDEYKEKYDKKSVAERALPHWKENVEMYEGCVEDWRKDVQKQIEQGYDKYDYDLRSKMGK